MADSTGMSSNRAMNPWALHLQKLGLELKCPLCLNFLKSPTLFPCNHMFCRLCVPRANHVGLECPICKDEYVIQDLRHLSFMENIVTIYRSLDAAFSASMLNKDRDGVGKSGEFEKCRMLKDNVSREHEALNQRGIEEPVAVQGYLINYTDKASFDSPLSYIDPKSSDNDSSDQGSAHHLEDYSGKGSSKRNFDDTTMHEKLKISALQAECHLRECKRQKKLDYHSLDSVMDSSGIFQDPPANSAVISNIKDQPNLGIVANLQDVVGEACQNKFTCGFCQTSRVTEVTGPMLHYLKGVKVNENDAMQGGVIHVHRLCTEWAPQVYYDGEYIKNLEAELARSSKLKCSKCGLKGAALGCYVKSCRRSYHIPCAKEVDKCRWDMEDYLLLCPAHNSVSFRNEKRKTSKRRDVVVAVEDTQILSQQGNFWGQMNEKQSWVFCGSALSSDEKFHLVKFASMIDVPVLKYWSPNVTHVIASTDADGACTRTFKVLMAISTGKWVLQMNWIRVCMEAMSPVNEEPYEVGLDNHGCLHGPKTGRLRALENAPKLFEGFNFYFSGVFVSGYKEDLQNLVTAAGGTVLKRKEELSGFNCTSKEQVSQPQMVIVYSLDPPPGSELGEEVSIIWKRANEAQDIASEIGGKVTGHTWLLESIAAHKLQPFVN